MAPHMSDLPIQKMAGHVVLERDARSSRELAKLTGVSRASLDSYRAGTATPREKQRAALAKWGVVTPASLWEAPAGTPRASVDPDAVAVAGELVVAAPTSSVSVISETLASVTAARRRTNLSSDALARLASCESMLALRLDTARAAAAAAAAPNRDDELERLRAELAGTQRAVEMLWTLTGFFEAHRFIGDVLNGNLDTSSIGKARDHIERRVARPPDESAVRMLCDFAYRDIARALADVDAAEVLRSTIDRLRHAANHDVAMELADLLVRARRQTLTH